MEGWWGEVRLKSGKGGKGRERTLRDGSTGLCGPSSARGRWTEELRRVMIFIWPASHPPGVRGQYPIRATGFELFELALRPISLFGGRQTPL